MAVAHNIVGPNSDIQREFLECPAFEAGFFGGKKCGKALTPDHDVLTNRGWVPIGDIKRGDFVAGLKQSGPHDRGHLVYAAVTGVFEQDHDDKVLTSKYRPYFKASPEHRWLVSEPERKPPRTPDNWHYITSEQMGNGARGVLRIPVTGDPIKRPLGCRWSDEEMELWGWYIAEGNAVRPDGIEIKGSVFSQYKPHGIARIVELLHAVGADARVGKGAIRTKWIPPLPCGFDCYEKFIPRDAMAQPNVWKLIEGFIAGDGEHHRDGFIGATASRQLADDIQEVCLLAGWRCTIAPKPNKYVNSKRVIKNGKGRIKNAQNWRLHIRARRWITLSQKFLSWEHYQGKTHCLEVPETSNFIARRNGSPFVTGNTGAVVLLPLAYVQDPRFSCLILRRETPDLAYLEEVARLVFKRACPGVYYNQTKHLFIFPHPDRDDEGARVKLGFAKAFSDCENFQGHKYQMMIFDEITQWPDDRIYTTLAGELLAENDEQTGKPWMQTLLRCTANPMGPGSSWVKKRFEIARFPDGKDPVTGRRVYLKDESTGLFRCYFKATVFDNPAIDHERYTATLRNQSDMRQKAMIYGEWVEESAAFPEFDQKIHVCEPFEVPRHYELVFSMDYGYSTYCACHLYAINPENRAIIGITEWMFSRTHPRKIVHAVKERLEAMGYSLDDLSDAVTFDDAFGERDDTGLSAAEHMIDEGLPLRSIERAGRMLRFQSLVHRLTTDIERFDGTTIPSIRWMRGRFPFLMETLPSLPKKEGVDDVDKEQCKAANNHKGNDHGYDALTGMLVTQEPLQDMDPMERDSIFTRHDRMQRVDEVRNDGIPRGY